jgi:hypothetical protein
MLIGCWSPKGGAGVTVFTSACALSAATRAEVVLVDTCGDVAPVLGVGAPIRGWRDVLLADELPIDAFGRIAVEISPSLRLVGPGDRPDSSGAGELESPDRGRRRTVESSVALLRATGALVFVDLGLASDPDTVGLARSLDALVMVTRSCFLSYRRAAAHDLTKRSFGAVLFEEPARALSARDLASTVGLRVVARAPVRPDIGRAIDAGTLAHRVPETLARAGRATLAALRASMMRGAA